MIGVKIRQTLYYHSVAVDARVYVRDTARLLVYDDFQVFENLAGAWPMHDHTTGEELFNGVVKYNSEKLALCLNEVVSISTDGAQ
jgi:hypothetical protein